ncbi:MAG: hypothetical protein JO112_09485 [Planctomycetes bacterium]|nr:hypothetical protein [Planctomycetota bacterium]
MREIIAMSGPGAVLEGFAYGEHLEGAHQRSLGYRLLAPTAPAPWCPEVETLARRLQMAPYPDHWPPTELFCSTLLEDGRRLVALARYGLADHTASQRRGGLELLGVLGPGNLSVPSALALYEWLRQCRQEATDLRTLAGHYPLEVVLAEVPPGLPPKDPIPVLPIRIWQEGALLFAATTPSEPDHRLGLLEQGVAGAWQWLPLIGADFPIQSYAQRGPVIAWTPHLAGVALKLDRPLAGETRGRSWRWPAVAAGMVVLFLLLTANLWATLSLSRASHAPAGVAPANDPSHPVPQVAQTTSRPPSEEQFVHGLDRMLHQEGAMVERSPDQLAKLYERLASQDPDLHTKSTEGKEVVVAVQALAQRTPEKTLERIRKALEGKGYDPELVNLACRQVQKQLAGEEP